MVPSWFASKLRKTLSENFNLKSFGRQNCVHDREAFKGNGMKIQEDTLNRILVRQSASLNILYGSTQKTSHIPKYNVQAIQSNGKWVWVKCNSRECTIDADRERERHTHNHLQAYITYRQKWKDTHQRGVAIREDSSINSFKLISGYHTIRAFGHEGLVPLFDFLLCQKLIPELTSKYDLSLTYEPHRARSNVTAFMAA